MNTPIQKLVTGLLAAFKAKDLDATLAYFADDAVFIDPHYPNPQLVGKQAIADGFTWTFATLEKLNFAILNFYTTPDEQNVAVEVATAHVFPGGKAVQFTQTFIVETRNGQVVRLQSYTPYGPNGLGGLFLQIMRLRMRLTNKG